MTVKMVLEKSRNATAHCSGKRSALLLGKRIKNRHMETLVYGDVEVSVPSSRQNSEKCGNSEGFQEPSAHGLCCTTRKAVRNEKNKFQNVHTHIRVANV